MGGWCRGGAKTRARAIASSRRANVAPARVRSRPSPRTRALHPLPSRRRGFAFDASRPPRLPLSGFLTNDRSSAPQASSSRHGRLLARRARRARTRRVPLPFSRVAHAKPADLEDPDLCDVDNGARPTPRPPSRAEPIPARDATSHTFPASSHRRAAGRPIIARALPSRLSSARRSPTLPRLSRLSSRHPPRSSVFLFPLLYGIPSSRASRPSDPAPQSGTARRRTDSSARTTYRRRARPRRSTAT